MITPWLSAPLIVLVMAISYGLAIAVDAVDLRYRRRRFMGPRGGSAWRRRLSVALLVGAVAGLGFAFGQIRLDRQVKSGTVVLAIDVSRSMNATDVQPSRLAAAEAAAGAFLERLPSGIIDAITRAIREVRRSRPDLVRRPDDRPT